MLRNFKLPFRWYRSIAIAIKPLTLKVHFLRTRSRVVVSVYCKFCLISVPTIRFKYWDFCVYDFGIDLIVNIYCARLARLCKIALELNYLFIPVWPFVLIVSISV